MFKTEKLIATASTISSSILAVLNPSGGICISCSPALLTSIAVLITEEDLSKLKIRYTKPRAWINVFPLLYQKALKT